MFFSPSPPPFLILALAATECAQAAGPGQYNDPDMLVVGVDGMTPYGIVNTCPEHVKSCTPGKYISREQWGQVSFYSFVNETSLLPLECKRIETREIPICKEGKTM